MPTWTVEKASSSSTILTPWLLTNTTRFVALELFFQLLPELDLLSMESLILCPQSLALILDPRIPCLLHLL